MALRHSLLLGLGAGLLAVMFRLALQKGQELLSRVTEWGAHHGWQGWLALVLASGTLILISRQMVRSFAPETSGSGIPHAKAAVEGWRFIHPTRVLPVKFVAGWLALTAGLALGREGPTVQMGAALGEGIRRHLKLDDRRLLGIGAGAGLTAAFNAPLAGCYFIFEELRGVATPDDMFKALLACTASDWVCRGLLGQGAVMQLPDMGIPDLRLMPIFIFVGIAAGVAGAFFNKSLVAAIDFFNRLYSGRLGPLLVWVLSGLVVGTIAWRHPNWVGSGEQLAQSGLLLGAFDPFLTVTRFLLTLFSYALGTPGGIFAPLLVLGSQVGNLVGTVFGHVSHASLVIVGMGAMVTACVQAPFTGVLLLLEMSGRYAMIFPLTVACGFAYLTSRACGAEPIFDLLMERDRQNYRAEQAAAEVARTENPDSSREQTPSETR